MPRCNKPQKTYNCRKMHIPLVRFCIIFHLSHHDAYFLLPTLATIKYLYTLYFKVVA